MFKGEERRRWKSDIVGKEREGEIVGLRRLFKQQSVERLPVRVGRIEMRSESESTRVRDLLRDFPHIPCTVSSSHDSELSLVG